MAPYDLHQSCKSTCVAPDLPILFASKAEGGVVVSACFRLTPWGFFLFACALELFVAAADFSSLSTFGSRFADVGMTGFDSRERGNKSIVLMHKMGTRYKAQP